MARRVVLIVVVVAGLIVGGGYCMSQMPAPMAKQDDPATVASAAIAAIESRKAEDVTRYCTPIPGRQVAQSLTRIWNQFDTVEVSDLTTVIILREGSSARVHAVFDMVVTRDGMVDVQPCDKVLKLVQQDGKWWINEAFL